MMNFLCLNMPPCAYLLLTILQTYLVHVGLMVDAARDYSLVPLNKLSRIGLNQQIVSVSYQV